jgi:hypothetical protein
MAQGHDLTSARQTFTICGMVGRSAPTAAGVDGLSDDQVHEPRTTTVVFPG